MSHAPLCVSQRLRYPVPGPAVPEATAAHISHGGFVVTEPSHSLSPPPSSLHPAADLSVREHLLFYSRLKGVRGDQEAAHVTHAMREVGLLEFASRRAKQLSGGMRTFVPWGTGGGGLDNCPRSGKQWCSGVVGCGGVCA